MNQLLINAHEAILCTVSLESSTAHCAAILLEPDEHFNRSDDPSQGSIPRNIAMFVVGEFRVPVAVTDASGEERWADPRAGLEGVSRGKTKHV